VTVRVVDALEAVDVDHGEGGGLAVAGAALDLALEVLFEAAPVREPGEGSCSACRRSCSSSALRSVTSWIWLMKCSGRPASSVASETDKLSARRRCG
jgi:hypothetical protein